MLVLFTLGTDDVVKVGCVDEGTIGELVSGADVGTSVIRDVTSIVALDVGVLLSLLFDGSIG